MPDPCVTRMPAYCVDWGASCENKGASMGQVETGLISAACLTVCASAMALMFSPQAFSISQGH